MRATLGKTERLSGTTAISRLMSGGKWGTVDFMRYCVLNSSGGINRILVSVPKRMFKRAVKRNLLKRRIREAYRIRKHLLSATGGMDIMFVYNSKEIADFNAIGSVVEEILKRVGNAEN